MGGFTRRDAMRATGATALSAALAPSLSAQDDKVIKKGRIKQSAAFWCWKNRKVSLDQLIKAAKEFGMPAIDILNVKQWEPALDNGIIPSAGYVGIGSTGRGLNEKKHHKQMIKKFEEVAPKAKKAGVPTLICFFGTRHGMSDNEGIANSLECLEQIKPIAEQEGINLFVENLNLVNHKDYIGALTSYCFKIIKAIDSSRIKLLYDIYHAQMMEGNIINTIKKNHKWIGHYHTGGVPGRAEIDETQELFYPPIVKAIIDTGYTGYMAHEFIPKKPDPIKSLRDALVLCDV